jgi:hypothetical protein
MYLLANHLNASSPIIFTVPNKQFDTTTLEEFLLTQPHKAPIYFTYDYNIPTNFSHVKTSQTVGNTVIKKMKLQNAAAIINSSTSFERERVVVISANYDTFATVPKGSNDADINGITIAAFLEVLHLLSRHPVNNNWVFWFVLFDGKFCKYEGLERFLRVSAVHAPKVEFAISL